MKKIYDWILFDLGGVLFELAGTQFLLKWMKDKKSEDEFNAFWMNSPAVRLFEEGKIDSREYAGLFIEEAGLTCTPNEFIESFGMFIKGPFDGAFKLLKEVRRKSRIACLSNTNALHWEELVRDHRLDEYFDRTYLSFKMGMMKPSEKIYEHVAEDLGTPASRLLFFDDNAQNVLSSRKTGMDAFQVKGPGAVRLKLKELGLL